MFTLGSPCAPRRVTGGPPRREILRSRSRRRRPKRWRCRAGRCARAPPPASACSERAQSRASVSHSPPTRSKPSRAAARVTASGRSCPTPPASSSSRSDRHAGGPGPRGAAHRHRPRPPGRHGVVRGAIGWSPPRQQPRTGRDRDLSGCHRAGTEAVAAAAVAGRMRRDLAGPGGWWVALLDRAPAWSGAVDDLAGSAGQRRCA